MTAVAAVLSVGIMLYGISHFGLGEAWPELVLNLCYIACLVMMVMYFFKRLESQHFNYWSSVFVGITVTPAGHPFSTSAGKLPNPVSLPYAIGATASIADFLLCPQGLEELHQTQSVASFHH